MSSTSKKNPVLSVAVATVSLLLGIVLYANYDAHFSEKAKSGRQTAVAIRYVLIGMDSTQVRRIMGKADEVLGTTQYYAGQPGSSASYQVAFTSSGKVARIGIIE
ncbi:MAG: hypothetical protein ACRYFZ_09995 [Janthinobacterium lividum]